MEFLSENVPILNRHTHTSDLGIRSINSESLVQLFRIFKRIKILRKKAKSLFRSKMAYVSIGRFGKMCVRQNQDLRFIQQQTVIYLRVICQGNGIQRLKLSLQRASKNLGISIILQYKFPEG